MSDLVDLYQEMVLDHNNRPRNFHKLDNASNTADGYNPLCGDQISVYLKVEDGVIADVGFQALFEGFHAMVTRDPGTEYRASGLGELEVLSGVCAFPNRIKCASLAWHTLTASLHDSQGGHATTE